jgi:DNA primase
MLLQHCEWWHELSADDHHALVELTDWHAELFRWVERWLTEHGPQPWPGLREAVEAEPWGERARTLVDGAALQEPPTLDDLRSAVAQARAAEQRRAALELLGRR